MAFNLLLAEVEQQRNDRAWERRYVRPHGARKLFRVHSDDPRKHHLHGEGVGVGDEEADDGTLEGSELAEFEEERARYRDEEDDEIRLEARRLEPLLSYRLALLFPLLDSSPPDCRVSQSKLTTWLLAVERAASLHRTRREREVVDGDADSRFTLDEALGDKLQSHSPSTQECRALAQFLLLILTSHFHSPPCPRAPMHHKTVLHELMAHEGDSHDPVEALVHLHAAQAVKDKWSNDHRRPHRKGGEFREALEEKERQARGRFEELDKDGDG
ncbi:unnamed protein product [Closterium sp. Naga37s-1]|nr:unnamed protein product [Closterium sp. Naga37s-1]